MDEAAVSTEAPKRRSIAGRVAKWAFGLLGGAVLLVVGAVLLLNTPIGERFLADRIARHVFPNGLNIAIGRIDGNIYGDAVLHDVRVSDPQGVFLTIPRAEIDWNPRGWLRNRLDIDSFVARRGNLSRIPEFLPSEDDGPVLPGFDIAVDRFEIDNLTLAPGIAGDVAQRVDLAAEVQVRDRLLFVDGDAKLGTDDTLALLLHAEPDGDDFDLSADISASEGGAIAGILGVEGPYEARLRGDGTWSAWKGGLLVRSGDERIAALRITNREGVFGILGKFDATDFVDGLPERALGNDTAIKARLMIDDRKFDGRTILVGRGILLDGDGLLDLAENRVEDYRLAASLRDPALFDDGLRLNGTTATATLNGAFDQLDIVHELRIGELVSGETRVTSLRQQGTASYDGKTWTVPLAVTAGRVSTGNALVDPRLVDGVLRGQLALSGNRLVADDLSVAFRGLAANLALRGDLDAGRYQLRGPVRADGLVLDNVGRAGGTAMADFELYPGGWKLGADLDARVSPVTNATLANLAGPAIRVRGGIATGSGAALDFNRVRVSAEKLQMALDGSVSGGATQLAGSGTHTEYGDFTVEARIADDGPTAQLVFARPFTGLENVRVAIAPSENGFAIDTQGDSVLGPFDGILALFAPANGPTRIDVERLTVSETSVSGGLTLVDGGVDGVLALTRGGLEGTIALAPQGGRQGLVIDLTARDASFGGDTSLTIARADIDVEGLLGEGNSSFSGTANAQGVQYGRLFIARLAAQGKVENGVGSVDARITGQRGVRFALDLKGRFQPERIAVAAQGEFAGRAIYMPRRAYLTKMEDGGWRLSPTQLSYGDGGMVASGEFGGGNLVLDVKLARMPLSLGDVALSDLGLGGTISGVVEYRSPAGGLPTGSARVKVDDLTRSGLVLSSKPMDLSLVARLETNSFEARAVMESDEIRRGRVQAYITGLPAEGDLTRRLRAGRLDGQLRFQGAAESLWRLAAVEAFDLTGPVSIAANASGSLAEPRVRGTVASDDLRVRSALSGTDVDDVSVRGSFAGSRLRLTRFAGTTVNGGKVSGSGIVDLEGLGERVEGRFVEIRGPTLDLRAAASNARLVDANGLSATVTGPLRIISNGLGGTIAGRLRVDRASWRLGTAADDLRLPRISTREINLPADRRRRAATARPWRYLIDAKAESRIDVDGMGLDSEWRGNIILRGTTDDPRIGGTAEVVRGDYTFAGTRFELTRGEIDFDESVPINPRLDIRAETEAGDTNVIVTITGNAVQPEITFASDPSLPEEEILARLLFGGSITTLSATDALQLGAAVASLRGGGGMDPINQLRSAIGLDRLRIVSADPALGRGTGIALGKNIGRRFYVEIITDGKGYSATQVEFRITSWVSLLASVSTIGRESVVAEISRDY